MIGETTTMEVSESENESKPEKLQNDTSMQNDCDDAKEENIKDDGFNCTEETKRLDGTYTEERLLDVDEPPIQITNETVALGNDSGVDIASNGGRDPQSCASSLISCGSGCYDSFDMLSCKAVDRLDDFKNNINGDGTSEGGSESSSVTGTNSSRGHPSSVKRSSGSPKKKVAVTETPKSKTKPATAPRPTFGRAPNLATRERARSRDKSAISEKPPPIAPKPTILSRSRMKNGLDTSFKEGSPRVKPTRTSTARCQTPGTPPDDKCPNQKLNVQLNQLSKNNDLMVKSLTITDSKSACDKYATLPRRRKENVPETKRDPRSNSGNRETGRNTSIVRRYSQRERDSPPLKTIFNQNHRQRFLSKIKIYHETHSQTALSAEDLDNALKGLPIEKLHKLSVEKSNKNCQVDFRNIEMEKLQAQVKSLTEANQKLQSENEVQNQKLKQAENQIQEERTEKLAAQAELQSNTQRLLKILDGDGNHHGDSLGLLESQLQTSANIVKKQQEEIIKLHSICREYHKEIDKFYHLNSSLEAQLKDQEIESSELLDFLQEEKLALQDALYTAEENCVRLSQDLVKCRNECRALVRHGEQKRQEALALHARLASWNTIRIRCQNSKYSSSLSVLPVLSSKIRALLDTLIVKYKIPMEDLEDIVYHNEAFSRSASSEACSPGTPPPQIAVSTRRLSEDENSADLLDSETEPCLMMENVLEDVQINDTYSHNILSGQCVMSCPNSFMQNPLESFASHNLIERKRNISFNKDDSCNSLHNLTAFSGDELSPVVNEDKLLCDGQYYPSNGSHDALRADYSENSSLHNLSQAILIRQQSEAEWTMSEEMLSNADNEKQNKSSHFVDQVIIIDNLINKLLKVLKIIGVENEFSTSKFSLGKSIDLLNECAGTNGHHETLNHKINMNGIQKEETVNGHHSDENGKFEMTDCWSQKVHSDSPVCPIPCGAEDQTSPRHSIATLGDCNANAPQTIDSAA